MCCGFWGVESCGANAVTSAATLSLRGVGWPFPASPPAWGQGPAVLSFGDEVSLCALRRWVPGPPGDLPASAAGETSEGRGGLSGTEPPAEIPVKSRHTDLLCSYKMF